MQLRMNTINRQRLKAAGVAIGIVALALILREPLARVLGLTLGAVLMGFVAYPLARVYEKRLSRPLASLLALLTIVATVVGLGWLLLPAVTRELIALTRLLPSSFARIVEQVEQLQRRVEAHIPGVSLPGWDLSGMEGMLSSLITGAIGALSGMAESLGQLSMAMVLAYFFLRDRESMLLRLELLLPQSQRHTAVRLVGSLGRELRLYLRGQLLIAGAVGLLSALALLAVGVRSALLLGPIIGIFNMIPYFGPFIGGLPAVLIALGDDWQRAALTLLALSAVQQLDGSWLSPRIMGSVTGFSPAMVLVGIYAGARLGGIAGMLLALPVMLAVRTLFRVFVQKYENI